MKLLLLGDIAFLGKCSLRTNPNANDYFTDVTKRLEEADFVIGNLETPFSEKKKTHGAKSAYICSDVNNIVLLKQLHVKAVTLANNHMFDYGKEGYEATKRLLDDNGIQYFGAEGRSLNIEIDDNHLSFEGFCCYSSNPLQTVPYGEYGINEYNVKTLDKILSKHELEGRLSIVAVHAGLEHVNYPSLDHVKAARMLAKRHNYIYYGHHPHVAQGIENNNGSLIAYSLGNFCFDDIRSNLNDKEPQVVLSENNRKSFMLEIEIEHNEVKSYSVIPIYMGMDKLHVGKGVTIDDLKKYTDVIDSMSAEEYNTMRNEILAKHINERKAQRTIRWYLKRMRLRYVHLLFNTHRNKALYDKCVKFVKL